MSVGRKEVLEQDAFRVPPTALSAFALTDQAVPVVVSFDADAAQPDLPTFLGHPDLEVVPAQGMTVDTLGLVVLALMFQRSQRHKVVGIPAALVLALVMHLVSIHRLALEVAIGRQVDGNHPVVDLDSRVSVTSFSHPPHEAAAAHPALPLMNAPLPQSFFEGRAVEALSCRRPVSSHPSVVLPAHPFADSSIIARLVAALFVHIGKVIQ